MVQLKYILLLLILSSYTIRCDAVDPPVTNLREYIKQEIQEYVTRALSEADQTHAAQIASLNEKNKLCIQQVKQEHKDDINALKNSFEAQIRDLRMRLDMRENSDTVNHFVNDNIEAPQTYPEQDFDNDGRFLNGMNGSSKEAMLSHASTERNQPSEFSSLFDSRYPGSIRRTNRQETVESRVAFFATIEADKDHLGAHDNIIFEHVFTNYGDGYNNSLGTFIAPVEGVYVFACTLSEITSQSWAHFTIDGLFVVAKFDLSDSANRQSSHTIVINLLQGQSVSVQHTGMDKTVHGDRYSSFSGFLLY